MFADVQLLTDPNFRVDVLVQRNRLRGVLAGAGDRSCILSLDRKSDIRIGDIIVTSGFIDSFPKGLPVGKVSRISYEADKISQKIVIQPWVNYESLEELIVLNTQNPYTKKILKFSENNWPADKNRARQ